MRQASQCNVSSSSRVITNQLEKEKEKIQFPILLFFGQEAWNVRACGMYIICVCILALFPSLFMDLAEQIEHHQVSLGAMTRAKTPFW